MGRLKTVATHFYLRQLTEPFGQLLHTTIENVNDRTVRSLKRRREKLMF
jgi:hypothetical protein